MKVSVEIIPQDIRCITLDGRLDPAGVQAAEAEFDAAVAAGSKIVVDLSKVPFIASVGVRLLVKGSQAQAKKGGKMVMMNPDELTRRILKTTGIDQLIPVFDSREAALAAFA